MASNIGSNGFLCTLAQSLQAGGSETTFYISTIKNLTGETLSTADFSTFGKGVLTIDPLSSTNIEYASFTGIDSTNIACTGGVRNLSGKDYTVLSSTSKYHAPGTTCILSFGVHNISDLIDYIDDAVAAITVGTNTNVIGVAGETVSAGNLVYLKNDGKWWKTDADTASTVNGVQLGIAQGSGTSGNSITNGVLLRGLDTNQSGLTAGTTYYASNTAGAISSSAGTTPKAIGVGKTASTLYFDPNFSYIPTSSQKDAMTGNSYGGTPTLTNPFVTINGLFAQLSLLGDGSDGAVNFDGTNTFAFASKSGNTYTLTRDIYATNLTIAGTVTVKPSNYRIFANGTVSGTGTIQSNGGNGGTGGNSGGISSGGTGGTAGAGITGFFTTAPGFIGQTGGYNNGGSTANPAPDVTGVSYSTSIGSNGVAGGNGGNATSGSNAGTSAGGTATGLTPALATQVKSSSILSILSGTLYSNILHGNAGSGGGGGGAGGSWGSSSYGGGGGGGGSGGNGGFVLLVCNVYAASLTVQLLGGNGGNGGSGTTLGSFGGGGGGGGGAGGNGGTFLLFYVTKTGTNTYTLTGGSAGTGGAHAGNAVDGSTGTAGATGTSYEYQLI